MAEHFIRNEAVAGSIPATGSMKNGTPFGVSFFIQSVQVGIEPLGSAVSEAVRWTDEQALV